MDIEQHKVTLKDCTTISTNSGATGSGTGSLAGNGSRGAAASGSDSQTPSRGGADVDVPTTTTSSKTGRRTDGYSASASGRSASTGAANEHDPQSQPAQLAAKETRRASRSHGGSSIKSTATDDDNIETVLMSSASEGLGLGLSAVASKLASSGARLRATARKFQSRARLFKSKGGLCVLAWSVVFFSVRNMTGPFPDAMLYYSFPARFFSRVIIFALYVLSVMAADLWLGRHRLMLWGTTFAWLALIVVSMGTALSTSYISLLPSLFVPVSWLLLASIGRILFQSNVIQFGADQLPEGSSDELSSFVHWFIFSMELGNAVGFVMSSFVLTSLPWFPFALAAVFSLLLVLLHCCSDSCFSKEPPNKSAYSIIYQVLKYAWKHKFPERRAFMYWDEKPPSRMDLGKGCNGGPFTFEQVEDVKAFLRLLGKILIFLGIFLGLLDHFFFFHSFEMLYVHLGLAKSSVLAKLSSGHVITSGVCILYVILHEFVAIPFFRRYVPNILRHLWFSFFLYVCSSVSSLVIDNVWHISNENATCLFNNEDISASPPVATHLSPYLVLIPNLLTALAYIISYIASLEFILAQSPIAFRGLAIGLFYTVYAFGYLLGVLAMLLSVHVGTQMSCGSLYFLLNTLVGTGGLVFFTVVVLQYKYRKRGGSTQHTSYRERGRQ